MRHHVQHQRRLGGTKCGGAGLHRHRRSERAKNHRRTGPNQLGKGHANKCLSQGLRSHTSGGYWRHRAGEDERREDARLIVPRVHLGRAEHCFVPNQWRRRVDEAGHHRAVGQIAAERNASKIDAVLSATCSGNRTHERLVAVLDVRIHHVEMALVHGDVDGLAHRATRVMDVGRRVRQFYEVLEVGERGVPAAIVEIANKR